MLDLCVVSDGGWPRRTGGVSTWTQALLLALYDLDVAVVSIEGGPSTGEFSLPRAAKRVELTRPDRGPRDLPEARAYITSGLESAELALRIRPDLAGRFTHVEHGDALAELLAGALSTESGKEVRSESRRDRARLAAQVAARRRRVVAASACTVGVTPRTRTRALREIGLAAGARRPELLTIPNAVPPPEAPEAPRAGAQAAYVGRPSAIKGIDRVSELGARMPGGVVAVLPAERESEGRPARSPVFTPGVKAEPGGSDPWRREIGLLLLPSRLEACPFSALEAEARGIPVLLSDAASLSPSPLVERRPYGAERWAERAAALLSRGTDPELGARIAARRWARFSEAWRALVAR